MIGIFGKIKIDKVEKFVNIYKLWKSVFKLRKWNYALSL